MNAVIKAKGRKDTYQEPRIIYNNVDKSLSEWAEILNVRGRTLLDKVRKAAKGKMSWEEAMADEDTRADIHSERCRKGKMDRVKYWEYGIEKVWRDFISKPLVRRLT